MTRFSYGGLFHGGQDRKDDEPPAPHILVG